MRGRKPVPTRLPHLARGRRVADAQVGGRAVEASDTDVIKIRSSNDKGDLLNEGLMNSIHEFLIKKNFIHTVEVFQKEMLKSSHEKPPKRNYDEILVEVIFDD
jgi:hypothetical protein